VHEFGTIAIDELEVLDFSRRFTPNTGVEVSKRNIELSTSVKIRPAGSSTTKDPARHNRNQKGNRKGTVPFPEGGLSPFLGEKVFAACANFPVAMLIVSVQERPHRGGRGVKSF